VLRRPISKTTNSLSVPDESAPSWGSSLAVAARFSRHSGSRASLSRFVRRGVCLGHIVSLHDPRPSRITRKSYRRKVSNRTMVATSTAVRLCWFRNGQASLQSSDENRWERNPKPLGHQGQQPSIWRGRSKHTRLNKVGCESRKNPAAAEVFSLDFPFHRTNRVQPSSQRVQELLYTLDKLREHHRPGQSQHEILMKEGRALICRNSAFLS